MLRQLIVCVAVVLGSAAVARAAPKAVSDTLDVTTYRAPTGWTRTDAADKTNVGFMIVDEAAGAAAQISVVKSAPGSGTARTDFDQAWSALVASAIPAAPAPTIGRAQTRDGWKLVRGTAKYTFEGLAATTTLLTATRDTTFVVVIVNLIGKRFQKEADAFLASLRFSAPTATAPVAAPTTTAAPAGDISGAWGFSSGGAMGSGRFAAWLNDRREYAFDGKGGYTFLRWHNVDREPDSSLIRERGTYTLEGDVLTLTPTKSEREIWKKIASGAKAGSLEKLLKREKVKLEPTTYRVSFALYLDTKIPNLVLTPSAATEREGNFNASTQYRYFRPDGKYYTAVPPTP